MNRSSFYSEDSDNLPKYKIIILGKSASGKTALLTRYQQDFYSDAGMTTISVDVNYMRRPNALYCYYDTAGQQAFRSIVDIYYKGSDACIVVYDVSQPSTFDEISFYYNKIKEMTEDSLIYIVGCKNDLQNKITDLDVGKKYKGIKHLTTSAKLNKGVQQLFHQIQKDLILLKLKKPEKTKISPMDFDRITRPKPKDPNKKPCCH